MKFKDNVSTGGGTYVKLENGEKIRGVFRGEVFYFKKHWIESENVTKPCAESDDCEYCNNGSRASFGFRVNFLTKVGDSYEALIFEQGATVHNQLKALNEDYAVEKTLFNITKNGTGKKTTYTIMPDKNGALTPEQEERISKVPLLPLALDSDLKVEKRAPMAEEDVPF